MAVLEVFGLVVLGALVLSLGAAAGLFLRRRRLQRWGGFDVCFRLADEAGWSGGWTFGVGRYRGDRLEWYRTFSLAPRPKRVLDRDQIVVTDRRELTDRERYELPRDHVVLQWSVKEGELEASMSRGSATAFLAWVESAPPGLYY